METNVADMVGVHSQISGVGTAAHNDMNPVPQGSASHIAGPAPHTGAPAPHAASLAFTVEGFLAKLESHNANSAINPYSATMIAGSLANQPEVQQYLIQRGVNAKGLLSALEVEHGLKTNNVVPLSPEQRIRAKETFVNIAQDAAIKAAMNGEKFEPSHILKGFVAEVEQGNYSSLSALRLAGISTESLAKAPKVVEPTAALNHLQRANISKEIAANAQIGVN